MKQAHLPFSVVCAALLGFALNLSAADKLPDSLFLKESPATAENVGDLKKKAKEGEEVTVRGQIGGSVKDVFNNSRAVLTLADMKLVPCNKIPGDNCPTPWDFCCVPANEKAAGLATIQVVDEKGKLIKATLKGVNGLDYLSIVTVKGKVAKIDGGNLIVNATGIFVEAKEKK